MALELTLKGANILDWRTSGAEPSLPLLSVFWRLLTGPVTARSGIVGPAMLKFNWVGTNDGAQTCAGDGSHQIFAEMRLD